MGIHQPKKREVYIYQSVGEHKIALRVKNSVFVTLVNSKGVEGYTVPLSGPAVIVMKPNMIYLHKKKQFSAK